MSVYHYESGKPLLNKTEINIKDVIKDSVTALKYIAADKESQIYFDIEEDLPLIYADSDEIGRVLSNLLGNAIKHTRKGTQIKISAYKKDGYIQVAVQDNGKEYQKTRLR